MGKKTTQIHYNANGVTSLNITPSSNFLGDIAGKNICKIQIQAPPKTLFSFNEASLSVYTAYDAMIMGKSGIYELVAPEGDYLTHIKALYFLGELQVERASTASDASYATFKSNVRTAVNTLNTQINQTSSWQEYCRLHENYLATYNNAINNLQNDLLNSYRYTSKELKDIIVNIEYME